MTILVGTRGGAREMFHQDVFITILAFLGEPCIKTAGMYPEISDDTLVDLWSGVLPKCDRILFLNGYEDGRFGIKMHMIAEASIITRYYNPIQLINDLASGIQHAKEVRAFLRKLPLDLSYLMQIASRPQPSEEQVYYQSIQNQMRTDSVDGQSDLLD